MQFFVRGLENIETLEVQHDAIIAAVKAQIAAVHDFACEDITLNCASNALTNDISVNTLETPIWSPMLGGKVHGSLASVGKAKGQTPKVEKQETKKKKTGRAKRRTQYNRRFNNFVQGFGRRRDPNANSA